MKQKEKIIFKKLESNNLTLNEFTVKHINKRYISWLNDQETVKFSRQKFFKHSRSSCLNYYKSFIKDGNILLAIILKDKNLHIGNIGITIDFRNMIADIAIIIGEKKNRSRGLGGEAWNLVIKSLIQSPFLKKITAGTVKSNKPMIKLMQNSKMTFDGSRKKHFLMGKNYEDLVYYAIYI